MLISHLPAGYLATKIFINKVAMSKPIDIKTIWIFGLLFSIAPDFDLFYFYFVDSSLHHHKLFPHIPLFWVVVFIPVFILSRYLDNVRLFYIALVSSINVFLHLILDTFVGFVWWLYPIIDHPYYFWSKYQQITVTGF